MTESPRARGRTLSNKQQAFVREYLKDNNATQAAIRAGYSERTAKEQGCRLLTKVHVQAALQAEQARLQQDCDWDVAEKKRRLRYVFDMADKGNPVTDRYGNPTGEYQRNYAAMVKSVEVMGKFDGELTEKRDVTTRRSVLDMSMEELKQELRMLDAQLAELGLDSDGKPLGPKH